MQNAHKKDPSSLPCLEKTKDLESNEVSLPITFESA